MAEKKITPKAAEAKKVESSAKTPATRVTKKAQKKTMRKLRKT